MSRFGRAVGCLMIASAAVRGGASGDPEPAAVAPPIGKAHADPGALERAVLDATLAFLRADLVSARSALDRIEDACKRLRPGESVPFASEVIVYDQAFHTALDFAREYAVKGRLDDSFDQFVWIQRGCRGCHATAGKPHREPSASGVAHGSPAER